MTTIKCPACGKFTRKTSHSVAFEPEAEQRECDCGWLAEVEVPMPFSPTIAWAGTALGEMPDARTVRDVYGYFAIDGVRVVYSNDDGDERFPWRVYDLPGSDPDVPEGRLLLEEFPTFRQAVRLARSTARRLWEAGVKS